jgi:hypothetical protein
VTSPRPGCFCWRYYVIKKNIENPDTQPSQTDSQFEMLSQEPAEIDKNEHENDHLSDSKLPADNNEHDTDSTVTEAFLSNHLSDSKLPADSITTHEDGVTSDGSYDYNSYDIRSNKNKSDDESYNEDDSDNDIIMSLKKKLFQQPRRSKRATQPIFVNTQMANIDEDSEDDASYSEDSLDSEGEDDAESAVDTNRAKGIDQRKYCC